LVKKFGQKCIGMDSKHDLNDKIIHNSNKKKYFM